MLGNSIEELKRGPKPVRLQWLMSALFEYSPVCGRPLYTYGALQ
jgi:hypothetical protein